jgi:hypothetical protein
MGTRTNNKSYRGTEECARTKEEPDEIQPRQKKLEIDQTLIISLFCVDIAILHNKFFTKNI